MSCIPFVESEDGLNLYYEVRGYGENVILLHWWTGNFRMYSDIINELSKRYSVIGIDMRGHGKSDKPRGAEYTVDALVRDLKTVVETLSIDNPILIGHSMGGACAMDYAAKYDASRVILISTSSNFTRGALRGAGAYLISKLLNLATLKGYKLATKLAVVSKKDDELINYIAEESYKTPKYVAKAFMDSFRQRDSTALISNIKAPTMVIVGEDDMITPFSEAKIIKEKVAKCIVVRVENASHAVPFEKPALVTKLIHRFLERTKRA